MSELLQCRELTKRYGALTALDRVDLSLESGKIIGLLGPNGSGKTTLIKIVNDLLKPDGGMVLINGMIPGTETKKIVSYLPDNPFLNSWMTVKQIGPCLPSFMRISVRNLHTPCWTVWASPPTAGSRL